MYLYTYSLRQFFVAAIETCEFLRQSKSLQSSQEGKDFEAKATWDRIRGRTWDQEAWWKHSTTARWCWKKPLKLKLQKMMDGWMERSFEYRVFVGFWRLVWNTELIGILDEVGSKKAVLESSTCRLKEFNSFFITLSIRFVKFSGSKDSEKQDADWIWVDVETAGWQGRRQTT